MMTSGDLPVRGALAVADDRVDDDEAAERAGHEDLAVGEVEQLQHAVDQRVAEGDQRVHRAAGQPQQDVRGDLMQVAHSERPSTGLRQTTGLDDAVAATRRAHEGAPHVGSGRAPRLMAT